MMKIAVILTLVVLSSSCSKKGLEDDTTNASTGTKNDQTVSKVSLSLVDPESGSTIYSDSQQGSSLRFKEDTTYSLILSVTGAPSGTQFQLEIVPISVIGGATVFMDVAAGSNSLQIDKMGDYNLILHIKEPNAASSASYQAQVSCSKPTFTSASKNLIKVTAGSATNLFKLSSKGISNSANGLPPYKCAWDPTGTGIVHTGFADCETDISDFYSNYVGERNVGLVMKDSCNTVINLSNSNNLAYSANYSSSSPVYQGEIFIFGESSNASGNADGDSRADDIEYLATNKLSKQTVTANYSNKSFKISAFYKHDSISSKNFGMEIKVVGLTESSDYNINAGTGTINAASASLSGVLFQTDQAGDSKPQKTFSGSNCVLSNQGASVVFSPEMSCQQTGKNRKATVQVWGHYKCTGLSSSGGAIDMEGNFNGYYGSFGACIGGTVVGGPPPQDF